MGMTGYYGRPYARYDIAGTGSSQSIPSSAYLTGLGISPRVALVTIEGAAAGTDYIRYTLDGTTPNGGSSPKVGAIMQPNLNTSIPLWGPEGVADFRFLSAGTVTVHVDFFQ